MKIFALLLITVVFISGCSSDCPIDPTLFSDEGFTGITFTDQYGNIIGPVDPNDWNLHYGNIFMEYFGSSAKTLPFVIPADFNHGGAYPNPGHDSISLEIAIPARTSVSYVILNSNLDIVYNCENDYEAGEFRLVWDYHDNYGRRVLPGIYRMVYQIGSHSGYGDIWCKR